MTGAPRTPGMPDRIHTFRPEMERGVGGAGTSPDRISEPDRDVPEGGVAGALFRLAVAGLGLTPAAAWAASPREVLLAAAPMPGPRGHGGAEMSRAELEALIGRYPDRGRPSPDRAGGRAERSA